MSSPLVAFVDEVAPGLHWLAIGITLIGIPTLVWLIRMRFDLRKDQRETRDNITKMLGLLVEQQRAELNRLVSEGDALRRQIDLFIDGRWQLQRALDDMREQMIAARTLIHDYERRIGIADTAFPPMPALAVIPRSLNRSLRALSDAPCHNQRVPNSAVGVSQIGCRATAAHAGEAWLGCEVPAISVTTSSHIRRIGWLRRLVAVARWDYRLMAFVRTALIIMALLLGWTALRHQGLAHGPTVAPSPASSPTGAG